MYICVNYNLIYVNKASEAILLLNDNSALLAKLLIKSHANESNSVEASINLLKKTIKLMEIPKIEHMLYRGLSSPKNKGKKNYGPSVTYDYCHTVIIYITTCIVKIRIVGNKMPYAIDLLVESAANGEESELLLKLKDVDDINGFHSVYTLF